ncbi:MAG: HAMP domain-containing sensor histidine kinase [Acidobacteriota bacterium]|nr:HAMP domain-containing sensor histidine kinase [Acidobacteriota bacterium]
MTLHRRVTVASVLICVAVLLPTAAWFVTGSREVSRRSAELVTEAELDLRAEVEREALRLGNRLEDLRRQESDRPFFHYQTLYHDPRGAAQGLSVTPSPLASGASDPLVWAHFQIDETGLVTLPTVSERFPELGSTVDFGLFCSRLSELQNAVVMDQMGFADRPGEERLLTLTELEWRQIQSAETVYATLMGRHEGTDAGPLETGETGKVEIRVGPLTWHTMVLGSGPTLAALREVHTPAGIVLQGFAVATQAVASWLGANPLALRFSPGPATSALSEMSLVANTGWILNAELTDAVAPAVAEGDFIRSQFRRTFSVTAAGILLAAAAVVWILLQTDRLARQRAQFAAAAAHELKTPLTGLLLHSQMLSENIGDPENRKRYAATVGAEAERLGRVVTNMLDLSRLERGADLAHPQTGDLSAAVRRFMERSRPQLENRGIAVEESIPSDLPPVSFDEDGLSQILDNLLDNAEKHTRSASDRKVRLAAELHGSRVLITVADNGPGIPRHQRRRMFRPFDRPAPSAKTPGLGLGLALARSLARAQGGDLELAVDDTPGATFVLSLPVAESQPIR